MWAITLTLHMTNWPQKHLLTHVIVTMIVIVIIIIIYYDYCGIEMEICCEHCVAMLS